LGGGPVEGIWRLSDSGWAGSGGHSQGRRTAPRLQAQAGGRCLSRGTGVAGLLASAPSCIIAARLRETDARHRTSKREFTTDPTLFLCAIHAKRQPVLTELAAHTNNTLSQSGRHTTRHCLSAAASSAPSQPRPLSPSVLRWSSTTRPTAQTPALFGTAPQEMCAAVWDGGPRRTHL